MGDDPTLQFLQLVAEPVRWQLLGELAQSDRRVGELVSRTGRAQNLVSYHLRELRAAGLVSARRSSADGRDTYYRLEAGRCDDAFADAAAALGAGPAGPARPPRRARPRVLFLCTGNSARSQMAQALLEHRTGGAVEARSAGSHPKPLHPEAVRVMAARGIDIAGRPSTHLDRVRRARFDRVVTLCDKVRERCPELPGSPPSAHWSMPDPAADGAGEGAFDRAADELEERVQRLAHDLLRAPTRRRAHANR